MSERIVVGVDGSPPSLAALRWAVDEATRRGAEVDAVLSWEVPVGLMASPYGLTAADDLERSASLRLDKALAEAGVLHGSTPAVHAVVRDGPPVVNLLAQAEGADLLVVGAHGHGAVHGVLLGSVSLGCVSRATCPVVVIPASRPT